MLGRGLPGKASAGRGSAPQLCNIQSQGGIVFFTVWKKVANAGCPLRCGGCPA